MDLYEELLLHVLYRKNAKDRICVQEIVVDLQKEAEKICYHLLNEIKEIICNKGLEDESCFEKIESIFCLFEEYGIDAGGRHDFG